MSDQGRIPPNDMSAEAAVLSAIMLSPEALGSLGSRLKPEDMYSEAHRRILEAALDLASRGQPVDVVQVGTWLKDRERAAQIGGLGYLTQILNSAPAVANVNAYADTIIDKARVRSLIATCQRIVAEGYVDYGTAQGFIDRAEQAVYEIARSSTKRPKLRALKYALEEQFREWEAAYRRAEATGGPVVSGIPTGFDRLDRVIGGSHKTDLTIVAGRPGTGKTSFAAALAVAAAHHMELDAETGERIETVAAFFSLEMPDKQLGARALCSWAEVDLRKGRQGAFSPSDWPKLTRATIESPSGRIFVNDMPGATLLDIRGMLRELDAELRRSFHAKKAPRRRVGLVIVDYLQLMKGVSKRGEFSREQEVSEISRGLKGLAKDEGIAVVALSQLNRSVETRSDHRPMLSDLRESGAIEQDADNIVFLYRDELYDPDTEDKGIAEAIVAKQRNGPTGTVRVGFKAPYTKFYELPESDTDHEERERYP